MAKGQKFKTDTPTFAEIKRHKTQHMQSVDIIVNPELVDQMNQLRRKHVMESSKDKKENRTPLGPGLLKQVEALEEEALEYTVTFKFKDLGRKKFESLWRSVPPTEEQKELGYEWDPDAFGPLIMSEGCVQPKLSINQAQEIYDEWSTAEAELLVMTAINANMGVTSIPLSATAIGGQQPFDSSLITAPTEESPTPTT